MRNDRMHDIPLAAPFFVALFLFFVLLAILVELRILQYAYWAAR